MGFRDLRLDTVRGDLFGGVTAMTISLPLSMAFGVASGMGAAAGLYGSIAVGFFASEFGGTPSQISSPTPPTTVAMAVIVTSHATSITEALTVVIVAGLIQVLLGLSKVGRFMAYTPYVVVSGFMSGIGIMLMVTQVLPCLGAPLMPSSPMDAIQALPEALRNADASAVAIATVTLAIAILWPQRLSRFVPSLFVALVVSTLLAVLWLNEAPVIGELPVGLPTLQLESIAPSFLVDALRPAIMIALIGSVNSLMTSLVADALTGTRHNPDRELVGQGIGNVVAGLVGGLPGAGALTSTGANIRCGGSTRLSGALRATLTLMVVLGFGRYLESIPLAALAAVLLKVAWDNFDWHLITRLHRMRREHVIIMLVTLILTVCVDLLTAVAVGLIVGGLAHAHQLERLELDSVVSVPLLDQTFFGKDEEMARYDPLSAHVGMVALRGSLTVASSRRLVSVIGPDIKEHEIVIFDFSDTTYLDDSAAMLIRQLVNIATKSRTEVVVVGVAGLSAATLRAFSILDDIPLTHFAATIHEARPIAKKLLRHRLHLKDPHPFSEGRSA